MDIFEEFLTTFLVIIFALGMAFVFIAPPAYLRFRVTNKPLDDFYKQKEIEQKLIKKSETAVIPFVEQLDIAIGKYSKYEIIHKLREETIIDLKKSFCESPQDFKKFSNSIDHRLWAYKWLCNITLEELGTGKHHLRNTLKPEGYVLANLNRHCLKSAHKYKYIDKQELEKALKSLDDQIHEIGTWA